MRVTPMGASSLPRPCAQFVCASVVAFALACAAPMVEPPRSEARLVGEAAALSWTVGTWEGVRRDGADGSEAPMTLTVRTILGGHGTTHEIEIAGSPNAYRGFAVQIPTDGDGAWVRHYTNEGRGRFARLDGAVREGSSTWHVANAASGRLSRLESTRRSDGLWQRVMHLSEDDGKTWRILWTDELERRRRARVS